jgi:hypothetical protein
VLGNKGCFRETVKPDDFLGFIAKGEGVGIIEASWFYILMLLMRVF